MILFGSDSEIDQKVFSLISFSVWLRVGLIVEVWWVVTGGYTGYLCWSVEIQNSDCVFPGTEVAVPDLG